MYLLTDIVKFGRYTVARMIDIGAQKTGSRITNIIGEDYGYIVSHLYYGNGDYWTSRNWTLTLTGLQSTKVEIYFEKFDVEKRRNGSCVDYLLIDTLDKFCEKPTNPITANVNISTNQISFTFITDSAVYGKGFWLYYRGNFTLNLWF